MSKCPQFEACAAPLCPEAEGLDKHVWYRDEPICTSRKHTTLAWVKAQRKLAKAKVDGDLFFSVGMLAALRRVTPRTQGADPADGDAGVQKWIQRRNLQSATKVPALPY